MYYADRPMYYVGISMYSGFSTWYDAETPTADTAVAACQCGESGVIEETDRQAARKDGKPRCPAKEPTAALRQRMWLAS